jgi:hypothetical protein
MGGGGLVTEHDPAHVNANPSRDKLDERGWLVASGWHGHSCEVFVLVVRHSFDDVDVKTLMSDI